jgi:choline dehydrogenase
MASSTITPALFAATPFDYLIAGGGTAGLALAARLSENPKIHVGVIEAGLDRSADPLVLISGFVPS